MASLLHVLRSFAVLVVVVLGVSTGPALARITFNPFEDLTPSNDQGICGAYPEITFPTATTDDPLYSIEVRQIEGPTSYSYFPVGTTPIKFDVEEVYYDTFGYPPQRVLISGGEVPANVIVVDNEKPSVSYVPNKIRVENDAGQPFAVVDYDLPTGSDNCGVSSVTLAAGYENYEPGAQFPIGKTDVLYLISDIYGNEAPASFSVEVVDEVAPVVTVPDNVTIDVGTSENGAVVNYSVSATDNSGEDITPEAQDGFPSGATFPLGTTTVSYRAVDSSANEGSASFTVTVKRATTLGIQLSNKAISFEDGSVCIQSDLEVGSNVTPEGEITFYSDGAAFQSMPASNLDFCTEVGELLVGTHLIGAGYSGDDKLNPSLSNAVSLTVKMKADFTPVTVSLESSNLSSNFGDEVTFTATVTENADATPTGLVYYYANGNEIGRLPVGEPLVTSGLPPGNYSIAAGYDGDENFLPANSDPIFQIISKAKTQVSVSSSLNPSLFGQKPSFTATVQAFTAQSTLPAPSGKVHIYIDDTKVADVDSGSAFEASGLALGDHAIKVIYDGDGNYAASESEILTQQIASNATTTSLNFVKNPLTYGVDDFCPKVSVSGGGTPTGMVKIYDADVADPLLIFDLASPACAAATKLQVGSHSITAVYQGDGTFAGSSSDAVSVGVIAAPLQFTTRTTVSTSVDGDNVLLLHSVTNTAPMNSPRMTGLVHYFIDDVEFGTGIEVNVGYVVKNGLSVGSHTIYASYDGDMNYAASMSSTIVHVVDDPDPLDADVTLTTSANPSQVGQLVRFDAHVQPGSNARAQASPSIGGTVQFLDGDEVIGTVELTSGYAAFSTDKLSVGTHFIRACFEGNDTYDDDCAELEQKVGSPDSVELEVTQKSVTPHVAGLNVQINTNMIDQALNDGFDDGLNLLSGSQNAARIVVAPVMRLGNTTVSPTSDVPQQLVSDSMWRLWADVRYTGWTVDAYDGQQLNGMVGASARVSDALILGLVAGYESFDSDTSVGDTFNGDGMTVGGYLGLRLSNHFRADAQIMRSWLEYDAALGAASAQFAATRDVLSGGISHDFSLSGLDVQSSLRATGTWENQDAYTDSLLVVHGANDFNFGVVTSGTKISHRFVLDDSASFTPFMSWNTDYRFNDGQSAYDTFVDRLSGRVGAGASYASGHGMDLSLQGELGGLGLEGVTSKTVKATVSFTF